MVRYKYVSTTKLSMTNHNHSNQWKKFVSLFFLWLYFPIFLKWNNVMLFLFQMHQGDSGGTLYGKDYANYK